MTEPLPEPLSAAATGPPSRRGHPSPRRRGPPEGLPEATGRNQELHAQAHQEGTLQGKVKVRCPRRGARSPPAGRTRAAASRPGGPPTGQAAAAPGRHRVPGPRPVPRHHQGRKPQGGGNRGSTGPVPVAGVLQQSCPLVGVGNRDQVGQPVGQRKACPQHRRQRSLPAGGPCAPHQPTALLLRQMSEFGLLGSGIPEAAQRRRCLARPAAPSGPVVGSVPHPAVLARPSSPPAAPGSLAVSLGSSGSRRIEALAAASSPRRPMPVMDSVHWVLS